MLGTIRIIRRKSHMYRYINIVSHTHTTNANGACDPAHERSILVWQQCLGEVERRVPSVSEAIGVYLSCWRVPTYQASIHNRPTINLSKYLLAYFHTGVYLAINCSMQHRNFTTVYWGQVSKVDSNFERFSHLLVKKPCQSPQLLL